MASTTVPQPGTTAPAPAAGQPLAAAHDWRDPRYQAFALLRIAFTVAPIAFGLDKFFNVLVHWPNYLAPWINDIAPGNAQQFMYFVGAVLDSATAGSAAAARMAAMTRRDRMGRSVEKAAPQAR